MNEFYSIEIFKTELFSCCCHGYSAASKMASLLGEKLFEISGQGPAPSKDFYHFVIARNEVGYVLSINAHT